MLFALFLICLTSAHSNNESIIFNIESQVSEIKKTIEHSKLFLDSSKETSYIPLIESDIQLLKKQIDRLESTLHQSSPSPLSQKDHDNATLHQ